MSVIKTKYGDLLPCSGASDFRKKNRCAVLYYDSGNVRSVYLEEPTVLDLPAGRFQTELITFYEDGNVKRIFPLYGQTTAYWSIEEEMENAPYYDFVIEGGSFHIRPQCLFFYPSGKIRSITLWPGDDLSVNTPAGVIRTRLGVELYESGRLRSIQPHNVFRPLMMHAENSSLKFPDGESGQMS